MPTKKSNPARTAAAKAPAEAASAIQLLKIDHKAVDDLFGRLEKASEGKREELFKVLQCALTTHGRLEETIFYPAVRTTGAPDLLSYASEAVEEHRDVKILLAELDALPVTEARFGQKVLELAAVVAHHVREEEDEMFPLAEKALGAERLRALGARMEASRSVPKTLPEPRRRA